MMPAAVPSPACDPSSGGCLVSADGHTLPLTGARLTATARGGVAEVVLEQRFRNDGGVPLAVTYSFPLPADAAVGGYAFTIGERRIAGEIDRRQAARERFEQALIEGRTAALLEQERSSLFTQEIGNIPPGAEVVAVLTIDQRLRWLDEGAWEWRFPTVAAPRYLGEPGTVPDAERVTGQISDRPLAARLELALAVRDVLTAAPESPSHRLRATVEGTVAFDANGGVPLDRDVVVRWPVAGRTTNLALEVARPAAPGAAYGLLTVTPPGPAVPRGALARDLVVLLDTSGSMEGEPLDQARRVVSALVDTLGDGDRLELIEFSTAPRRWKPEPVAASAAMRREALGWLAGLRAGGGTEMRAGILAALAPLRAESQRQVVLVTDGLIGFEAQVVGAIATRLPPSSRVHTVGVGSAVNRALTSAVARAGRGVEVVIGLGEDAERAMRRIVAHTAAPLVVDLSLSGSALLAHAPAALPDLFAGAPALISVQLRPEGGELVVRGRTVAGEWSEAVRVPACAPSQGRRAAIRLHGRERVEDLETRIAAGEEHLDGEIERIGLELQVATRLTSWIAVSEEPAVDPGAPTRRVRMPQQLPHGMSVEGLGLRAAALPALAAAPASPVAWAGPRRGMAVTLRAAASQASGAPGPFSRGAGAIRGMLGRGPADGTPPAPLPRPPTGAVVPPERERRFRGRIALHAPDRLVIEIEVDDGDLDWSPGAEAELGWPDGRRALVKVLQGTRPGPVRIGETIRIVLELPMNATAPGEVIIAGRIVVML